MDTSGVMSPADTNNLQLSTPAHLSHTAQKVLFIDVGQSAWLGRLSTCYSSWGLLPAASPPPYL